MMMQHLRCVLYWMTRDQRVFDNYSILCAQELSIEHNVPIRVVFNLVPKFLEATLRQYSFMIDGLKEVEQTLSTLNVPFHLTFGDPKVTVPELAVNLKAIALVTDFSPLRVNRAWTSAVASSLDSSPNKIPLIQVDAHNIVPCWVASSKLEYGARTIRSKIQRLLPEYLLPFPQFSGNKDSSVMHEVSPVDWVSAMDSLEINRSVGPVSWIKPGETAAREMLESFCSQRLSNYGDKRNDPNEIAQSNLSPYLHFGQLSAQTAVLQVKSLKKFPSSTDSFVEEVVVRKELSDNFCYCT
jgi:deoxyribodipyrimidine photo-lyase